MGFVFVAARSPSLSRRRSVSIIRVSCTKWPGQLEVECARRRWIQWASKFFCATCFYSLHTLSRSRSCGKIWPALALFPPARFLIDAMIYCIVMFLRPYCIFVCKYCDYFVRVKLFRFRWMQLNIFVTFRVVDLFFRVILSWIHLTRF